jgi:N-acetyl-anhydromuramyl-L-alanine amidase AmpD
MRKIDLIVLHCSASPETVNYTFEQLTKDHKARGFTKCGYHYYIKRDGTRYIGRPIEEIGAHVGDLHKNQNSIGICYEGGLDKNKKAKDTRTEEQKAEILATILEVLAKLKTIQPNVKVKIMGHRDLSPDKDGDGVVEPHEFVKMCPCFNAVPEYKEIADEYNRSIP